MPLVCANRGTVCTRDVHGSPRGAALKLAMYYQLITIYFGQVSSEICIKVTAV